MTSYSWDIKKDRRNERKHGLTFSEAVRVFDDPLHVTELDHVHDGEERFRTIGMFADQVQLLLIHTITTNEEGEHIRVISARRTTNSEKKFSEVESFVMPTQVLGHGTTPHQASSWYESRSIHGRFSSREWRKANGESDDE